MFVHIVVFEGNISGFGQDARRISQQLSDRDFTNNGLMAGYDQQEMGIVLSQKDNHYCTWLVVWNIFYFP